MTEDIRSYKDLLVWQKAMAIAERIYALTKHFPKNELYGLTFQMRKAAVSIPSNIAEGHARESTRDYLRFLTIASGSLAELETQLALCERLNLVESGQVESLLKTATELGKQLRSLRRSLQMRVETYLREPDHDAEYVARPD